MRLILVPQYPAPLRYQEWWFKAFPKSLRPYFDDIIVLGGDIDIESCYNSSQVLGISDVQSAIDFELLQMRQFNKMHVYEDDILLLNDISFPGMFADLLHHSKIPISQRFAICHATSNNYLDYFAMQRSVKSPVELSHSKLFNKVFVASTYHKTKLVANGWDNVQKIAFPHVPSKFTAPFQVNLNKDYDVISVGRLDSQKTNRMVERALEVDLDINVNRFDVSSWKDYYECIAKSRIMLITAREETFGYQVFDAFNNGCIPLAPDNFSYPELISNPYLYRNYRELKYKVYSYLKGHLNVSYCKLRYDDRDFYKEIVQKMINSL